MLKCLQIMCAKYYKLRCTFYKKNCTRQSWRVCLIQRRNSRYFRCPVWKAKSWQKSKPTRKLKHANSILEYFEYFFQISSKSICTILSYTVSKLMHFFATQCRIDLMSFECADANAALYYREMIYLHAALLVQCLLTWWFTRHTSVIFLK